MSDPAEVYQARTAYREAVRRIVAERDFMYALLMRIAKETSLLQDTNRSTGNEPLKQRIYMFTVNTEDHNRLQDLVLHGALGRLPTPTPLPPEPM